MIKNILLILCTFVSLQISAQTCTPDTSLVNQEAGFFPLPDYGVPGEGGIDLDAAIGCPYEFVFQAVVPNQINLPQGTVPLDHVSLTEEGALINLPVGLDYICNPPDCFFPKESIGCIVIFGTPDASTEVGVYDLKLLAEISVFGIPVIDTFPGLATNGGNYFLNVLEEPTDLTLCPTVNTNNQHITPFEVALAPNPSFGSTTLTVDAERSNRLTFQLLNLTGQVLKSLVVSVEQGVNSFEINTQDLPEGMYLYSLGNEEGVLTDRLLIVNEK